MAMNDKTFSQALTFTRASTKWVFDGTGTLVEVPIDEPAYDHDPVTGEALGVLIEPEATNLLTDSTNIGLWGKTNVTLSQDTEGLAGILAYKIVGNLDATRVHVHTIVSELTSSVRTLSLFVKSSGCRYVGVGPTNTAGIWELSVFDLEGGVFVGQAAVSSHHNLISTDIESVGGGWFRVSATVEAIGSSANKMTIVPSHSPTEIVNQAPNDGTSGIYIWGAQVETGPVATGYIPTAGAAVTRAADYMSRSLGAEFNGQEGTFVIQFERNGGNQRFCPLSIDGFYTIYWDSGMETYRNFKWDPGGSYALAGGAVGVGFTIGDEEIAAFSFDRQSGEFIFSHNGESYASAMDTGVAVPTTMRLNSGPYPYYEMRFWVCRNSRYYPYAMTAAELEALTTL